MKGTARRGRHRDEDRRRAAELRSSEKERAENVMVVDLVRNDVARVAQIGSVEVPALFAVERYETVLQLTSDVTARLRPGTGLVELFRALFPCGSVTGAPKASSMAVIRSIEDEPRGVYCGAIGLVGPPDAPVRARFSVAIRTAAVDTATGEAAYGTGGGITWGPPAAAEPGGVDRGAIFLVGPPEAPVRAGFGVAIRTAVVHAAPGEAVYGTGGGIAWGSQAAAEHDEVLARAAVLRARPREFELLETMRHEPGRGLRNEDRHLQRLAESAEHLGFAFDPGAARELLGSRLAGCPAARVRL